MDFAESSGCARRAGVSETTALPGGIGGVRMTSVGSPRWPMSGGASKLSGAHVQIGALGFSAGGWGGVQGLYIARGYPRFLKRAVADADQSHRRSFSVAVTPENDRLTRMDAHTLLSRTSYSKVFATDLASR